MWWQRHLPLLPDSAPEGIERSWRVDWKHDIRAWWTRERVRAVASEPQTARVRVTVGGEVPAVYGRQVSGNAHAPEDIRIEGMWPAKARSCDLSE